MLRCRFCFTGPRGLLGVNVTQRSSLVTLKLQVCGPHSECLDVDGQCCMVLGETDPFFIFFRLLELILFFLFGSNRK